MESPLKLFVIISVFGNFLPKTTQNISKEDRIAKSCGNAIKLTNSINEIVKIDAVRIFVRLENTKRFEAKSLINPIKSKNKIKGAKKLSLLCGNNANTSGVRIKIAPSFARKIAKNAPKNTKITKRFALLQEIR